MSRKDLNETLLENSFCSDENSFNKMSTHGKKKKKFRSKKPCSILENIDCLFLNEKNFDQIKKVESCLWNHKNKTASISDSFLDKKDTKSYLPPEVVLEILS